MDGDAHRRYHYALPDAIATTPTPLVEFNRLDAAAARKLLTGCCASLRWADAVVGSRPFASMDALTDAADAVWSTVNEHDVLQALRAHPPIGDAGDDATAAAEQAGAADADDKTRAALAQHNRDYIKKFGFVFVVCAHDKTAAAMLSSLRARINNTREQEVANAAGEQCKITRLRIEKRFTA